MARVHRRGFVRPAAKTKIWAGVGVGVVSIGNVNQLYGVMNAAFLALRPFTILRTRLELVFESDQAAVTERPSGAFGIIVVSSQAVAAGAASCPSPITNIDDDFLVYQGLASPFVFLSSVGFQNGSNTNYVVDSKAMRKVGPNEELVLVTHLRGALGGLLSSEGRMLVQLH